MAEGIVEKHIRELYSTEEIITPLNPLVESLEQRLKDRGDIDITRDFLFLMFLKPQITQQLHLASARIFDYFQKALRTQDPKLVREMVFFVFGRCSGEFFATMAYDKPAAYDLPAPKLDTIEDPERRTMVVVHTHPPIDDILAPSVIVQRKTGMDQKGKPKYTGDLYAFWVMRKCRKSVEIDGREAPEFINRPLSLIVQDHPESESTKMLFIRESQELSTISEQEYIRELKCNKRRVNNARNERLVQEVLAGLGFQSSYLNLPGAQFYNYPLLGPNQIDQVVWDLDL